MIRIYLAVFAVSLALLTLAADRVAAQPAPVSSALLTVEDLPGEWTEQSPTGEEADDSGTFCGIEPPAAQANAVDAAEAAYSQGDLGPSLFQVVSRNPDAWAVMEQVRMLPVPCEGTETDEEGRTTTWTMDLLPFPSMGDELLAFRMSTTPDDIAYLETDMVFIRRGDVLSVLSIASVGVLAPPESQAALLESLASLVDERLAAVAE